MRITSPLSLWPKKKYDFLLRDRGVGFFVVAMAERLGIYSRGYRIYSLFISSCTIRIILRDTEYILCSRIRIGEQRIYLLILLFTSSFTVIYSWLHQLGKIAVSKGFLMGLYDFLGVTAIFLVCILARASFSIIESRKIYSSTCAEPAAF